ncbi:DDB1- and CUL4-associated factor 12-like [Haliotis asinina]|uniref:DDB1- and CUL4-associated factor 12-like n=1 Tax=Haliotis asinina TaxID=109174 RepID=UPI0035320AD3
MFRKSHKRKHFSISSEEELCQLRSLPKEAFFYTQRRQYGLGKHVSQGIFSDYLAEQIPCLLQEREYKLGSINKIFAAKWLSDKQVVFGTKCNQLIVLDTASGRMTHIPKLKSSEESIPAKCPCGIHSIAINPSSTLLATGANHTNDIAVYKLPTFDPVCVGELGHKDWVFDLVWIDDEFVLSGSRDNNLALWKIDNCDDDRSSHVNNLFIPEYTVKHPVTVQYCQKAEKVRALAFHKERKELAALSLNGYFHLWDIGSFTQMPSKNLPDITESVCMCVNQKKALYAVGCHSSVLLVDPRSDCSITPISKHPGRGIRSVSFNEDILTIGTGYGMVLFYDLRACKYIQHNCGHACYLSVGSGWLKPEEDDRFFLSNPGFPNAVYTHAYDSSGTRLFAAGGPLSSVSWGNYAGLWY